MAIAKIPNQKTTWNNLFSSIFAVKKRCTQPCARIMPVAVWQCVGSEEYNDDPFVNIPNAGQHERNTPTNET